MINVQADVEEVQKALAGTSKSIKSIKNKALSVIGRGTVKAIKQAISSTTTKRTGELYRAYYYDSKKKMISLNYSKNGDKIFPKVYTLNYGKDGTGWKPHSFVQAGEKYVQSGGYGSEIEKMVQKELDKYWS